MSNRLTWIEMKEDEVLMEYVKSYQRIQAISTSMANFKFYPDVSDAKQELQTLISERLEELKERKE